MMGGRGEKRGRRTGGEKREDEYSTCKRGTGRRRGGLDSYFYSESTL